MQTLRFSHAREMQITVHQPFAPAHPWSVHVVAKERLPFAGSSYEYAGAEQGQVDVSIYFVEAQPGRGTRLHFHEYDEVIVVQEGRSRFVAADAVREVFAGEIVTIPARTPHGFVNSGPGVLKQIDIHLSPRFIQHDLAPTEVSREAGLPT